MEGIGVLPGMRFSFLDHLVPLCALLEVPLLVTEPAVRELIELYYPPLEVRVVEAEDFLLDEPLAPFDFFVYVHFSRTGRGTFLFSEYYTQKRARGVFSLHGHPDKFRDIYWIEEVEDEDIVLAYGPALVELLRSQGIRKKPLLCGNYRLEYYQQHADFFDQTLPFTKEKKTILYAPTWSSPLFVTEQSKYYTGFSKVYQELFEEVPEGVQLLCKLHPYFFLSEPDALSRIKEVYPHVLFLDHYPLIYPLLKAVDIYLGDYSSIGYDFLFFNRPLFFIGVDQKTPLHSCGETLRGDYYRTILAEREDPFSERREALYQYVYGARKPLSLLKKEIEACVSI